MSFFLLLFLYLPDTVEEFEDSIMQKKMKIPKMSIENSGNSIENNFGEERMPLRHKKVGSLKFGDPAVVVLFWRQGFLYI